jgi:phage baseplate assembly protein W
MAIRSAETSKKDLLGNGLVIPLRRVAGSDFVSAHGEPLVRSCVSQIMGTKPGELRWRPKFGLNIDPYRHQNLTQASAQAMASEIYRALGDWEPRLSSVSVTPQFTEVEPNKVTAEVTWDIRTQSSPQSAVIVGPVSQEVEV